MAHTQSQAQGGFSVDTVVSGAKTLVTRFKTHMKRRAVYSETMRELTQLTDADLLDLGLSRANFTFIAREAANEV